MLIYPVDIDDPRSAGVVSKMRAQHLAFQSASLKTDIITTKNGEVLIYRKKSDFPEIYRVNNILPVKHFALHIKLLTLAQDQEYDFLYIRYSLITPFFIRFLKLLKKTNRRQKVLLELPTFPMAKEYRGFPRKIFYWFSSLLARRHLPKLVDRIVVYGKQSKVYQIPSIRIRNGADLSMFPLKQKKKGGKIRLIATGRWAFWHGLDRVLTGLGNYCRKSRVPNIEMIVIGNGPELRKLRNLSSKLGLESIVNFIGPLKAGELDFHFDHADIAIGSLGAHRKDLDIVSSLKHREYAARGIPFILSDLDPDFPQELSWIRYFPVNNEPIIISEVINFFESISKESIISQKIRRYAETNLTWNQKLLPVFNYILGKR